MRHKCFHVIASNGLRYGVAADGKREAGRLCTERMTGDGYPDPQVLEVIAYGTWLAEHGLVLCYGDA